LLLDTHVWLWMQTEPKRLGLRARNFVGDPKNELLLSAASTWEIAIKWAVGRLPLPEPPQAFFLPRIASTGVTPLAITHAHALRVGELPDHHRDPFDRMLVAQAQIEGIPILTSDRQLWPYAVELLWAAAGKGPRRR
jgi:PIN domain nuclease of toxin-antitoxin system